jgi:cytochrome c5
MSQVRIGTLAMLAALPVLAHAGMNERQAQLLHRTCVQCHAKPGLGVPLMGHADEWRERAAKGEDAMLRSVVLGLRGMPPLGSCSACDEADFRAMIRIMASQQGEQP